MTDDPGTPGNKNWEINSGLTTERRAGDHQFEAPIVDFNYGLGDRIQLKYEIPYLVYGSGSNVTQSGLGDSLLGVKYRFFENKQHEFEVSTYPQLDLNNPTHSVDRRLVARGPNFLLPIEVTKKVGPLDVNGEVGYWFTRTGRNYWMSGLALGHQATKRLEVLGEVYSIGDQDEPRRDTMFNLGGRFRFTQQMLLIFSAGRSFSPASSGQPQLTGYLGMQFQLSGTKQKPLE